MSCRIDLLTAIDGFSFDEAWPAKQEFPVDGMAIPVISREDFLKNKRTTGRLRDLAGAERLESAVTSSDEPGQ